MNENIFIMYSVMPVVSDRGRLWIHVLDYWRHVVTQHGRLLTVDLLTTPYVMCTLKLCCCNVASPLARCFFLNILPMDLKVITQSLPLSRCVGFWVQASCCWKFGHEITFSIWLWEQDVLPKSLTGKSHLILCGTACAILFKAFYNLKTTFYE